MFKQRLLTTVILLPLVLALILKGNQSIWYSILFILTMACGYEWAQLIPLSNPYQTLGLLLGLLLIFLLMPYAFNLYLALGIVLWAVSSVFIHQYPQFASFWGRPWIICLCCLLLLPLFAHSVLLILHQPQGQSWFLYLLGLVWAADIGAYIAGKCWGKHKLIPQVSPGKTLEGLIGGLLCCLLISLIAYFYFKPLHTGLWFLMAAIMYFVSLIGDLFISLLKRRVAIKDTGNLLPGHGGVLDRLDSLIAAAPVFYALLLASTGL